MRTTGEHSASRYAKRLYLVLLTTFAGQYFSSLLTGTRNQANIFADLPQIANLQAAFAVQRS